MSTKYEKYIRKYKELSSKNLSREDFAKQLAKAFAEIWFSNKMIKHTQEYQKKYGFDAKEGNIEFSTHNNEADAFKHTFMQAWITVNYGEDMAKKLGDMHENDGNSRNQPSGEENMDLWNNNQGREIGKELWKTFSYKNGYNFGTIPYFKFNDLIAEKVIQRMKDGKLITNPNDTRRYVPKNKSGTPTGQASPVSNTAKSDSAVRSNTQNFSDMIKQSYKSLQSDNNKKLNRIFKSKSSYTGEGHWVTMNGAHIFIED